MENEYKYVKIPPPVVFSDSNGQRSKGTDGREASPQCTPEFFDEVVFNDPRWGTGMRAINRVQHVRDEVARDPESYAKIALIDWQLVRDILDEWRPVNMLRARQQVRFLQAWAAAVDEDPAKPAQAEAKSEPSS